jgi:uncharacterized protein
VFPLAGALLLPRGQMPLNIFEPRYVAMIDDALRSGHRLIGMIQPDAAHPGPDSKPNLYGVGCVGRITQFAETGDGRYLRHLTGIARFRMHQAAAPVAYFSTAAYSDDAIEKRNDPRRRNGRACSVATRVRAARPSWR